MEQCKQCTFMPAVIGPTDGVTVDNGVELCKEIADAANSTCCDMIDERLFNIDSTLMLIAGIMWDKVDGGTDNAEKTVTSIIDTLIIYFEKITQYVVSTVERVEQGTIVFNIGGQCPQPQQTSPPDEEFIATPTPDEDADREKLCDIVIEDLAASYITMEKRGRSSRNSMEVIGTIALDGVNVYVGSRKLVDQYTNSSLPFGIYTSWTDARERLVGDLYKETDNPVFKDKQGKCNVRIVFVDNLPDEEKGDTEEKEREDEDRRELERKQALLDLVKEVPHWGNPMICSALQELFTSGIDSKAKSLSVQFGLRNADDDVTVPVWLASLIKGIKWIPNETAWVIADAFRGITDMVDTFLADYGKMLGCDIRPILGSVGMSLVLDILQKFTGIDLHKVRDAVNKVHDYACPIRTPSVAEASAMYLANQIKIEQWRCWTNADNCPSIHFEPGLDAQRARPNTHEVLQLWLRGDISESELNKRLRGEGFLNKEEAELVKKLAYVTPTPSDIIPMMVRDVFDESVIDEFKLGAEFEAKFGGKAEEYFRAAGLTKEIAKLHWMFHWRMPSNTQLFEMYHRLRGGKEGSGHAKYFDDDGNKLDNPIPLSKDDIQVTERDIARALGINDVNPFWRDRLLAISRPPLTRVDVRRAYEIDAITLERVHQSYRDLGYDDENAGALTKLADLLKKKGDIKRKGFLPPNKIITLYKAQSLTKDEAKESLLAAMLKPDDADKALQQADIEVKARIRSRCLAAIRKRYMIGDIDDGKLAGMLQEIGLDDTQSIAIREELRCSLKLKAKEVTAGMLCQWYSDGLTTKTHHIVRLQRIGYSRDDALRLADSCEIKAIETAEKSKGARGRPKKEREKRADEIVRGKQPDGEIPEPIKAENKNGQEERNAN